NASPTARPRFRTPRPFRDDNGIEVEELPVMFDVVFDPHAAAHIAAHELGKHATLARLDAVPPFPTDAIALNLVWSAVHARGTTTMPIWDGEPAYTDADGNPDRSWPRTITIDPERGDLDAFIHRTLGDDDLATARAAAHDPTLERGDYVALVAAHVTTKEI